MAGHAGKKFHGAVGPSAAPKEEEMEKHRWETKDKSARNKSTEVDRRRQGGGQPRQEQAPVSVTDQEREGGGRASWGSGQRVPGPR